MSHSYKDDDFISSRRIQREIIGEKGVEYVWSKSPRRNE